MGAVFHLEILTPEHLFFDGDAESLTFTTVDGQVTVLAGHIPFTAPLAVGNIRIVSNGVPRTAFQSEGFITVDREGVHLFVQACEWPEEIDIKRAERAELHAREKLRRKRNLVEYEMTKTALTRAMTRLRITHNKVNMD